MNKKLLVLSIVLAIGVLGLSGCGKSLSDRVTENLIEKSTGEQATVNTDDGNIKINVEGMNLETGSNVSLPANFPNDVFFTRQQSPLCHDHRKILYSFVRSKRNSSRNV